MIDFPEFLQKIKLSGLIMPLDFHLAHFFVNKSRLNNPLEQSRLAFLIILLSTEVRGGNVCLNLMEITKKNLEYRFGSELTEIIFTQLGNPTNQDWLNLCEIVGHEMVSDGAVLSPFILNSQKFYFQKMWLYEKQVASYFSNSLTTYPVDQEAIHKILTNLFPLSSNTSDIDWQKIAVVSAITRKMTIISGGPGTGKTTTISKILAALMMIHQKKSSSTLRIIAAAPTGKAAARLTESLSMAISGLPISSHIKENLPVEAVTLHRLLGARVGKSQYLYHKNNPLNVDILLIDEASMIDLSMMSSVIAALPDNARLILLGDKEQLSSVEAGAVFGDLCALINDGYSHQHVQMIEELTGYKIAARKPNISFADNICLLKKSYRFDTFSGIGLLANSIKEGRYYDAISLFESQSFQDIALNIMTNMEQYYQAVESCVEGYQYYLKKIKQQSLDIGYILSCFSHFRLLCALRDGPFGVQGLNKMIENRLNKQGDIVLNKQHAWYIGRPIMILKNSFSLGLFNGDIGITLPSLDDKTKLKVYFLLPNGEIKGFSPSRLPEHETAYAMTIHKSQGSEFDHVSIILPNEYSPLLTRSLLYTAVTRAKQKVIIYAEPKILERTIKSQTDRQSGLLKQIRKAE